MRAGLVRRTQQRGTDVRVVRHGASDGLALDGGQHLVGARLDNDHVGAGVDMPDGVRVLDGGNVPREVELVGGVPLLVDGGVSYRGELGAVTTGRQGDAGGLGVSTDLVAASVTGEPRRQLGLMTQPSQAGGNVEHRSPDNLDGFTVWAGDLIDESFPDVHDSSHSSTPVSLPFLRAECPWFRA